MVRAEDLRLGELERYRSRIDALEPAARETVEAVTRGLVNKLLHEPTVRVKEAAGSGKGQLFADALAELFALAEPSEDDSHSDEPPTA